ncbi:MAG: hypothetical protein V8T86_10165 [Victivallis sp.]
MRKRRPIIVSPSGNLYGSEKVLLDFLATAEEDYEIYLPEGRLRRRIAGQLPQVRLRVFSRVQLLYSGIVPPDDFFEPEVSLL